MQRRIVRSHMPLTRHEGPVACRFQHLRDRCCIFREPAPVSRLSQIRDHVPDSYLVRVLPRENARPRRTAPGGGIELRKAYSAGSQLVQVRRVDLSAKAAKVAIAQIIGHDQQDVRPPLLLDGNPAARRTAPETYVDSQASDCSWTGAPAPKLIVRACIPVRGTRTSRSPPAAPCPPCPGRPCRRTRR